MYEGYCNTDLRGLACVAYSWVKAMRRPDERNKRGGITPTLFLFPKTIVLMLNLGGIGNYKLQIAMKKNKKNEELQSRREFFKKAAKGTLPILGLITFGPAVLSSCDKDDDDSSGSSSGCKTCSSGCKGTCQLVCKGNAVWHPSSCSASTCKSLCWKTCSGLCVGSAKGR